MTASDSTITATPGRILRMWWPLAASWLMMGLELPAVSAVIARLEDPSVHLAAYGGVVFPLALLIEGPIIMLLAASTALSRDWESYIRLRRFMIWAAVALTGLHIILAATPLFDFVVDRLLGAPAEIQEPARIGLLLLTPWTAAIAYRRFQQGILIRFGRSRLVGAGTMVRLATISVVLAAGYIARWPGIVAGATAVSCAVIAEALFVAVAVRPVHAGPLRNAPPPDEPLTARRLFRFYLPLGLKPLLVLLGGPIASASMSRMPRPLDSLAVWPALLGLVFTLRSLGFAYNEVVVVVLDQPGAKAAIRRFTSILALGVTLALAFLAVTPLGEIWFRVVAALPGSLPQMARTGLWFALLMPAVSVLQSHFEGQLVHAHKTRGITEAVVAYLLVTILVLVIGVAHGGVTGLYFGQSAIFIGNVALAIWLGHRCGQIDRPPISPKSLTG